MIPKIWRLSENGGDDNLGLACTEQGLVLGRTLLIERRDGCFVVRERSELECLLSLAYGREATAQRLMPGLATAASALNADDQALARIARCICAFPICPTGPRAMPWRLWMSSSNTRATKVAMIGIRRCIRAPARRQIPAGLRQRTAPAANHFQRGQRKTTIAHGARMLHQAPVTTGSGCGPDHSASMSSPTSSNGSPTPSRTMSRR
jgi:hypothetical protein